MNEGPKAGTCLALRNIHVQLNDKKKEALREAKSKKQKKRPSNER
jgi:hypothetical protein